MSRFSGPQSSGAARDRKFQRRAEAEARAAQKLAPGAGLGVPVDPESASDALLRAIFAEMKL